MARMKVNPDSAARSAASRMPGIGYYGELIDAWLDYAQTSLALVSKIGDVGENAIRLIRQAKTTPRPSTVHKIAKGFGITVNEFLEGPPAMPEPKPKAPAAETAKPAIRPSVRLWYLQGVLKAQAQIADEEAEFIRKISAEVEEFIRRQEEKILAEESE